MANLLLRRYIEALIILKLELLEKPDTEEPFRAQIIIGFEPTNIVDFFRFFKPSAVIDANCPFSDKRIGKTSHNFLLVRTWGASIWVYPVHP